MRDTQFKYYKVIKSDGDWFIVQVECFPFPCQWKPDWKILLQQRKPDWKIIKISSDKANDDECHDVFIISNYRE